MIRRAAWALYWRGRAIVRLYRAATLRERVALTVYAWREAASHIPFLSRRARGEVWIRLRGLDVLVAIGRYELGGYMDVWLQRDYERAPDFRSTAGWLVVDVGANVGFFALRQAVLGANVVAIEANPDASARLAATIARNRLSDRIQLRPCAAGRGSGVAELLVGAATVTGTIRARSGSVERDRFVVEVRPLDSIVADDAAVDLLKIDTEGAEVEVLAGAAAVLRRTERVVLEWHDAALRREAGALLEEAGFEAVLAHHSIDYYRRRARSTGFAARENAALQPTA